MPTSPKFGANNPDSKTCNAGCGTRIMNTKPGHAEFCEACAVFKEQYEQEMAKYRRTAISTAYSIY